MRPFLPLLLPWALVGLSLTAQALPEAGRSLEARLLELERQPGLEAALERVEGLQRVGRNAEAEALLMTLLGLHPDVPGVLQAQVRLYRRAHRLKEALALLERLKSLASADETDRLERLLALDTMDFATAEARFKARLQRLPGDAEALEGLGEIAYWEDRYPEAEQHLKAALAKDPGRSRAWTVLALLHRVRQENTEWAACARKAVAANPLDDEARAVLADVLMRGEQKAAAGFEEARLALRLNPANRTAHAALGNGWSLSQAREAATELQGDVLQHLRAALKEGDAALSSREPVRAESAFQRALALDPRHPDALVGLGCALYVQGAFDRAHLLFQQALGVDPGHGHAHYGVAMSLLRRRDAANVRLKAAFERFAAQDAPEPAALRDVFPEYGTLDGELQKIVRLSVKPLAVWLPLLKERKLTFHIFPFHHRLFQAPHQAELKGQRTFDGRIWDDVKGVGGAHAAAGAEWQRDVKHLRFNVLAHEFAHQVHGQLPEELKAEIMGLYQKGKQERRTLDFYSDANEMEYFAVGVEAYVSEAKLPDQKITYGHTRKELLERDPALYALIEKLGKR